MNLVNKLVFVEKKIPYNIQAKALLNDFKSNLNLPNLKNIRIINRYLINNIDEQTFNNALISVFSEPPVDNYYIDKFPVNNNEISFAVSLLPGQFDQRASSTEQCLKLINVNNQSIITTAIVIVLEGKITNQQLKKIKHYYINPIESYEIKPYEINNNDDKIKLSKIQIIGEFIN
jgi:phosphoribosylformylglycinamidine synthase